jgi:beta-mannosidase
VNAENRVVASQAIALEKYRDGSVKTAELLFRASIIPGERPQFRVVNDPSLKMPEVAAESSVVARRIGVGRLEMANERFGVLLNLGLEGTEPALVAGYNKSAGDLRMLNLIDTSPDSPEPLAFGKKSAGFGTFSAGSARLGAFDRVEILESGPLRAKVRLAGARLGNQNETWEFVWYAGSPVLRWTASLENATGTTNYGYFFSSISASPYLPFDKWIEGVELKFPDGWETDNPPDHAIKATNFKDLPGGHLVYYQRKENYGALGFIELDSLLEWHGIGGPQFFASKITATGNALQSTSIALSFPRWKGTETVLEARKEHRIYAQPILSVVARDRIRNRPRPIATIEQSPVRLVRVTPSEVTRRSETGGPRTHSLNGDWKLNWAEKSEGEAKGFHQTVFDDRDWKLVKVPGTVHTQILESPRFFTREADWISAKEWWYRRAFRAPPVTAGQRLFLTFNATDYYADIYLNGELLARHEGYIDPYDIEVTGKLIAGANNQLAVRVWTPVSYYWRHRPYTVKGSYGAVDQKPDNITPLGVTRPVELKVLDSVRISGIAVDTRLNEDGTADVVVDLDLDAMSPLPGARVVIGLSPRNFSAEDAYLMTSTLAVRVGTERRRFIIKVNKPHLWWTWDHGKPNLYSLDIAVESGGKVSDRKSLAVGIREIEHIDWKFYLNGKRIFIRGTNYYYHLFQSEVRRADYERDLGLVRSMNVNMVRLHCNFSNPEFYDLADELGLLIWQDYLEAWYPEDRTFSLKAARLYDPHIRYVRNHPSVAIWATSDEESLENYRDLTKHLEPRLFVNDPQRRPVQRSTGRYGDAHVYEGWYGGTIWAYAKMTEKFVSELGATALPNYDSLMKFIPQAWPISDHEDEWVFRKLQIKEAMRAWGEPGGKSLQEYIPQTQDYVARLFQLAIERMRRLKYQPAGGILHFHAVDLWPSVTMAAIDFYRHPTKAFFTVQRSFQMVLPSIEYDRDTFKPGEKISLPVWAINDHHREIRGASLDWRLANEKGVTLRTGKLSETLSLAPDSSRRIGEIHLEIKETGRYVLWAEIKDTKNERLSENNFEFRVE